jgi:hypothetical protein
MTGDFDTPIGKCYFVLWNKDHVSLHLLGMEVSLRLKGSKWSRVCGHTGRTVVFHDEWSVSKKAKELANAACRAWKGASEKAVSRFKYETAHPVIEFDPIEDFAQDVLESGMIEDLPKRTRATLEAIFIKLSNKKKLSPKEKRQAAWVIKMATPPSTCHKQCYPEEGKHYLAELKNA